MKYLVIGAGAMGSTLAAFLSKAGEDVTLLARGANLTAIQTGGVTIKLPDGSEMVETVRAVSEADYDGFPDVVIVCVKSYSLDSIVPVLDRVCTPETVVLPVINALNVGSRIEASMSVRPKFAEGVAYVAVELTEPGKVKQKLDLFRFVLGAQNGRQVLPEFESIAASLRDAGLGVEVSDNMLRDALRKFVRVSTLSAAEVYYDTHAGGVRENPESMEYLMALAQELIDIANAAGIPLTGDPAGELKAAVEDVHPDYTTSLMLDYENGRPAEFESQFFDVVDLGRSLGLPMDAYAKVSEKVGYAVEGTSGSVAQLP